MEQIAPNIYVSTEYPCVSVGCVIGPAGVIAVDAPTLPQDALAWRRQISRLTDRPIVYTVLTDEHPHRLLSARLLGAPIVASEVAYTQAAGYTRGYWRNVLRHLRRRSPEQGAGLKGLGAMLPQILFRDSVTLHRAGTDMTVETIEGAHPGSAWLDLRDENVVFLGDTLVVDEPPVMDATPDSKAWLQTLTMLRRPRFSGVTLVPGRGPASSQSATERLSEYLRVARRRVRSLHSSARPRDDVVDFVDELLSIFSLSDEERNRHRRRVRSGLKHVYLELAPEDRDSG